MGENVIFMNRFTFYFQDTVVHCITCFVILYYQLSDDGFGNGKVGGVLHLLIMPAHTLSFLLLLLVFFCGFLNSMAIPFTLFSTAAIFLIIFEHLTFSPKAVTHNCLS